MERTKRSGAVLGFIVVGVILVAALAGGVYFISRQSAEQPMPEAPRQVPTKQPEKKPTQDKDKAVDATPKQEDSSSRVVTSQLPQTGTTETIGTILALGAISGVTTSYLRSRRQIASL